MGVTQDCIRVACCCDACDAVRQRVVLHLTHQGMVGTIDVNSDTAVWTADRYEGMLRSSGDAEWWAEFFC